MQAKTVDSATRLSTLTHKKRHSTPNSIIAKRRCIALKCQTFRDLGLTPTVSMEVFREVRGVAMESDRPQSPDVTQWTEPRRIPISPGLCESWILGSSPCKAKQLEFDSVSDSPEKDGVNSVNRITTKSTLEVGQLSQKTSESETTNGSTKSDSLIPNPLPNRPKVLFNYDDEIPCSQQSTNECEELKNNFAENTNVTTPIADSLSSRRRLTTSFQYVEDQSQSSETSQQQSQGQTPRIQQWPPASESNLARKALRGKFAAPRLSRCESGSVRNSETNKATTQFGDNNPTETPRKPSPTDMQCTPSENSIHVADVTETPIHTSVKIATETSVPVDNCSTSTTQSTCATSDTAVANCETGSMLNPAPTPSLFTTGSGKSVKFSAKALAEAKKAIEASETDSVPSTPAPAPSLFTTGSGKSVKFSAKALAEAKKAIEASETETEALPSTPAPAPSLFTTGSGKSVKFSAKALDAAAKAMEDTIKSNSGMGFAATAIPEPESLVKELRSGRHPKVGGNVVGGVVSDQNKLAGIKSVNRSAFKSPRPAASNLPSSVTANVRKPLVPLSSSMRNHGAQNVQQTPLQSSTRPQPRQPQGGSSPVPPRRLRFQSPRIDGSDSLGARQSKPANQRSQRKVALRIPRSPKRTISQKLPISSLGPLPKPSTCVRVAQSFGVRDAVLQITSKNAWLVQFDDGTGVPTSIREELEGKDLMQRVWLDFQARVPEAAKYVNVSWITNHFRWIVWKLAAMERMFPMSLDGELILLYSKALDQLSARFHREQICTERPVVRKILEKDISCRVHMVLCVARIISEQEMVARLELTDGWYSIETQAGPGICSLLRQGRIAVGQKLQVSGAQMLHNESGVDPLQCLSNNPLSWTNATDCARFSQPLLSIDVNNIKPAPWYATLGICNPAKVPRFEKTLSSARPGGGTVPFLQVVIDRVYPLMFREKLSDGSAVFRDEAAETKVAESELQRHFEEKQSKLNSKLAQLNCQNGVVGVNDMQHIRDQLEREFVPSSPMRDVSAFVRVRVVQYHRDESKRTDQTHPYGELTIWDASPEMLRTFKEGHRCELQNVRTVRGGSVGSLRLVANRQSRWSVDDNPCSESEKKASKYMPRKCWEFEELISSADSMSEQHMEIDTVFAVVRCEAKHCFVANHSGFFAALELPSSEPQTELLRIGKVLAVQNLEFVGRDPQLPLLRFRWSAQRTISLSRMPTNLKSTNWSHCTETVAKWQNDSQVSNTSNCMSTVWQNRMNELIDTVLNGTATELQARVETLVDEGFTIASVQSVRGNELSSDKGSLGDAVERTYGAPAMTSSSAVTSPNYAQLKKREKPVTNSTMYSPKRLRAQHTESGSIREIWVRNETLTKIMLARINVHVHGGGLGISKDCIGDTIRFKCGELFQDCRVKDCHEYPSLSLLVESEGVRNILAQPMPVAEAVNQLQMLNKHKKNSKAQLMESVIALRIDPIDSI